MKKKSPSVAKEEEAKAIVEDPKEVNEAELEGLCQKFSRMRSTEKSSLIQVKPTLSPKAQTIDIVKSVSLEGGQNGRSPLRRPSEWSDQLHSEMGGQQGTWPQVWQQLQTTSFSGIVALSKMRCFDFFLSNIQVPGKSSSRLQGVVPRSQRSGYLETRLCQGIQLYLQMQNHNLGNLYKVWGKNNSYPKPLCWRQAFLTR